MCLASIIFYIVPYITSFKYTFCIGPIALSTTIIIFKNIFGKRENEGETFGIILISILRLFLVLQALNILMKLDGFLALGWKEVYWPFWIFFSILIGLSFSIFLIMATKLGAFAFYRQAVDELLSIIWLFYFVDGLTVAICLFVIYSQSYLTGGDKQSFVMVLAGFIAYCLLSIILSSLIKNNMIKFMTSISNDANID